MSGVDRSRAVAAVTSIALGVAALGLAGCGGHHVPALHRSARPAWCPSTIVTLKDHRFRSRGHGRFDARRLVGLKLAAASQLATRNRCTVRVLGGDSNPAITLDARSNRINVDVEDGIVTALDDQAGGPIG